MECPVEEEKKQPTVLVIMGSVRAGRLCEAIARWVAETASENIAGNVELTDLRDWSLPMDAEPAVPAMGGYQLESTLSWSRKIAAADAVIFVTPQYNGGYPAALKNALDHLFVEWADKPAVIVTYGGHGGEACREQLRPVLERFKMRLVDTHPALHLPRAAMQEGRLDAEVDLASHSDQIRQAAGELAAMLDR